RGAALHGKDTGESPVIRYKPEALDAVSLSDVGEIVGVVELEVAAPVGTQPPVIPFFVVWNHRGVTGGAQGFGERVGHAQNQTVRVTLLRGKGQRVVCGVSPKRIFRDRAVPRVDGPLKNRTDVGGSVARCGRVQIRLTETPARSRGNVIGIVCEVLVPTVVQVVAQI